MNSISGGMGAILKATGIDISQFPEVMDGSGTASVMHDGHQWTIKPWIGGGGLAVVSRPLTVEEERLEDEAVERHTFVSFFGLDRLRLCRKIALEMMRLSGTLRPDCPPARAKRRELRKRLDELAAIQFDLMQYRGADAKAARLRLKDMGIVGMN